MLQIMAEHSMIEDANARFVKTLKSYATRYANAKQRLNSSVIEYLFRKQQTRI